MSKPIGAVAAILALLDAVIRCRRYSMKRLAAVSLSLLALAVAGTTSAADGSYGPWQSTYQGAITAGS
jgi:hypothetical protein